MAKKENLSGGLMVRFEFSECEETEETSEIYRKPINIEVSDLFEKSEESE